MAGARRWFDSLRRILLEPPEPATLRRRLHPTTLLRLALAIGRQWAADRSPQQAANLAFQTSLSLVPMLAIGFALMSAANLLQAKGALVDFLGQHVLPVEGAKLAARISTFASNLQRGALGPGPLASAVVLAYVLFHSVEVVFNDIWRVSRRRSLFKKFVIFYPLATLTPLLLGVTLYYTGRFWRASGLLGYALPAASTFFGLFLANKLLPRTHVGFRAAALGAAVSAVLFELAKVAFQLYVARVAFSSFQGTYGALVLVPIFLLWIYYSWLVVLFGAEVAYAAQNLDLLEERERQRLRGSDAAEEIARALSPANAARLLLVLMRRYAAGAGPARPEDLAEATALPVGAVTRICTLLAGRGILAETPADEDVAYLPALPPGRVPLVDILDIFEPGSTKVEGDRALQDAERAAAAATRAALAGVTYAHLLAGREMAGGAARPGGASHPPVDEARAPEEAPGHESA